MSHLQNLSCVTITRRGVIVETASGPVRGSRRNRYIHWVAGRQASGAWTGWSTVEAAWQAQADLVIASRSYRDAFAIGLAAGRAEVWARQAAEA